MNVWVYGINFRTAPLSFRELLCVDSAARASTVRTLRARLPLIEEICLLSTCNRTEFYVCAPQDLTDALAVWFASCFHVNKESVLLSLYVHRGEAALRHLIRVASGMDSMVLGETQIFSQVKKAYQAAVEEETVGRVFRFLFPSVFRSAKNIRTRTTIGAKSVSLASVGIRIARQIFSRLSTCRVMLIGAGQMMTEVGKHLSGLEMGGIYVANRSFQSGCALSKKIGANPIGLMEIPRYLHEVDIVFSATSSTSPVLGKGAVESALQQRKHKPMVMLDLGLPRDIEPEISRMEDVYLYDLDTVCTKVKENQSVRQSALQLAESLVALQSQAFMEHMALKNVAHVITCQRKKIKQRQNVTLEEALLALRRGQAGEQVVTALCQQLGKTLLHDMTALLKKVAFLEEQSRQSVIDMLQSGTHANVDCHQEEDQ